MAENFQRGKIKMTDDLDVGRTRIGFRQERAITFSLDIKKTICHVCGLAVYANEKITVDGMFFHRGRCFKCVHCKKSLTPESFAFTNGKFYCKPHNEQLFKIKGNYSSGFGEKTPIEKWKSVQGKEENKDSRLSNISEECPILDMPEAIKDEESPTKSTPKVEEPKTEEVMTQDKTQPKLYDFKKIDVMKNSSLDVPNSRHKRAASFSFTPSIEKCRVCLKSVYANEKISVDGMIFHKGRCFRCEICKKSLTPENFAFNNGKFYCKPHNEQLFKIKGNYSSGFGVETPKEKWAKDKANKEK